MALIQTSLIWVSYAVAIAILLIIASIFVFLYQTPRDRAASVTIVCIFTMSALLATVLLMPVDIALVSATTNSKYGRKKDWATPDRVENIVYTLKIVYYLLYSLDAVLCLLVVPFTYFWYEEYDEAAVEDGTQTFASRLWGAFKYTIGFIVLVVILFLVGFFIPFAKGIRGDKGSLDLDYFKRLILENRTSSHSSLVHRESETYLTSRRRTRPHLRPRSPHHPRHPNLHPLHCRRPSIAPSSPHQVRAPDLSPKPR
jgi:LMBR1 domain-containing protein 1